MTGLCIFTRNDALEADKSRAKALSIELRIPLVPADQSAGYELQLLVEKNHLGLCCDGDNDRGPVVIDWSSNKAKNRLSQVSKRTEPLARALGLKSNHRPTVVDATAGLGGDSIIISALGCPVIAIEKNPIVAALLANAIERAEQRDITLLNRDAIQWLGEQEDRSQEIVFLDPMFGKGETRAQVKKPMQLMQRLLATQSEEVCLLADALRVASKRVVVKRAAKAPHLNHAKPQLTVTGKAIRFDIYLCI